MSDINPVVLGGQVVLVYSLKEIHSKKDGHDYYFAGYIFVDQYKHNSAIEKMISKDIYDSFDGKLGYAEVANSPDGSIIALHLLKAVNL